MKTKRNPGYIGERAGRLVLLRRVGYVPGSTLWDCLCKCGQKVIVRLNSLHSGRTKSCGCLYKQAKSHGDATIRNRATEYNTWVNMRRRCFDQTNKDWPNYGGRGISVCFRWLGSYKNFLKDMGRKPTPKHTIDRINNSGNYEPINCRWATRREQNLNTRRN